MKSGVKVTKDLTRDLNRALSAIRKDMVLVGVPSSTATREPDPDDPTPINNAEIGYIMENGAPAANIPARPHLIPAVNEAKPRIAKRYESALKAALNGKPEAIDIVHTVVGQETADAVKLKIDAGEFTPLAPATIADRKRRGIQSEKPLTRTGQYRNAITFVKRPRKKG